MAVASASSAMRKHSSRPRQAVPRPPSVSMGRRTHLFSSSSFSDPFFFSFSYWRDAPRAAGSDRH